MPTLETSRPLGNIFDAYSLLTMVRHLAINNDRSLNPLLALLTNWVCHGLYKWMELALMSMPQKSEGKSVNYIDQVKVRKKLKKSE